MELTDASSSPAAAQVFDINGVGKGGARQRLEPSQETSGKLVKRRCTHRMQCMCIGMRLLLKYEMK